MVELSERSVSELAPELVQLLRDIESDASFLASEGAARIVRESDTQGAKLDSLAEPILLSPALTERVLRLANASAIRRGDPVTSVSKAVALLGFDSVKSMALMLAMLDEVTDEAQRKVLWRETAQSTAAMSLAREFAHVASCDKQRAGVQATLCSLGRVIVATRMSKVFAEIKDLARKDSLTENDAARKRLGMSYLDIAARSAASWRLGPDLCQFLSRAESGVEGSALAALAADKLASLLFTGQPLSSPAVTKAVSDYARRVQASVEDVQGALSSGLDDFTKLSRTLGFPEAIAKELIASAIAQTPGANEKPTATQALARICSEIAKMAVRQTPGLKIVEHALRGLVVDAGYQRALLLTRDAEGRGWVTRSSEGANAQAVLSRLRMPVSEPLHLLSAALERNTGLTIKDTSEPKVRAVLPQWFDTVLPKSGCFVLLPLELQGRTVAALYVDRPAAQTLPAGEELDMLTSLKDTLNMMLRPV